MKILGAETLSAMPTARVIRHSAAYWRVAINPRPLPEQESLVSEIELHYDNYGDARRAIGELAAVAQVVPNHTIYLEPRSAA